MTVQLSENTKRVSREILIFKNIAHDPIANGFGSLEIAVIANIIRADDPPVEAFREYVKMATKWSPKEYMEKVLKLYSEEASKNQEVLAAVSFYAEIVGRVVDKYDIITDICGAAIQSVLYSGAIALDFLYWYREITKVVTKDVN